MLCGDHDRPSIGIETYGRLMVLKQRTDRDDETLVREVSDSLATALPPDPVHARAGRVNRPRAHKRLPSEVVGELGRKSRGWVA
jgi:hypothetical protein